MPTAERPQLLDVVPGILRRFDGGLHPAAVDGQEEQRVDGAVASVFELLLLARTGDRSPDRVALEYLEVGFLVDGHDPDPVLRQSFRVGVAPQDLLLALFELLVEPGGAPVAGAVWLQVHIIENASDGPCGDRVHEAVGHRSASEILTRPGCDVQAFGHRLPTGACEDLGSLEGGNLLRTAHAGCVQQECLHAAFLGAAADAPDRGSVTLQTRGHRRDGLSRSNGEYDASMLDVRERPVAATSHGLQDRNIRGGNGEGARFLATHGNASPERVGTMPTIADGVNLLHYFCPGTLAHAFKGLT
nr:hypothetical protein [Fimbriiglobus ruber]